MLFSPFFSAGSQPLYDRKAFIEMMRWERQQRIRSRWVEAVLLRLFLFAAFLVMASAIGRHVLALYEYINHVLSALA